MEENICSHSPHELLLHAFQRLENVKEIAQIPIFHFIMKFTESHTLLPWHGMFHLTPDDLCTVTASIKHAFLWKPWKDQPSSILPFSHRFPSKKMNQTSLLAHNNLTKHLWAKDHWLFWNLWKIRKQKEAQKRIVQASGQF